MRKDDFFIQCGTAEKMQGLLKTLKKSGYVMASDFKKEIPTAQELLTEFKKYNHGNAKCFYTFSEIASQAKKKSAREAQQFIEAIHNIKISKL